MITLSYLDELKDSAYGIIILGAIGSLFATLLAVIMKTILDHNANLDKETNYNFGWMGGFCGRDITNYPIYLTFIVLSRQAIKI